MWQPLNHRINLCVLICILLTCAVELLLGFEFDIPRGCIIVGFGAYSGVY
jgi:hypothetical protein